MKLYYVMDKCCLFLMCARQTFSFSPVGHCTANFEFLVCTKAKFVECHFFGCGDSATKVYRPSATASAWYSNALVFLLRAI